MHTAHCSCTTACTLLPAFYYILACYIASDSYVVHSSVLYIHIILLYYLCIHHIWLLILQEVTNVNCI
jgi:hypothetical protein